MRTITINLIDTKTDKVILDNATVKKAAEHIGIPLKTFQNTMYGDCLIKGRYKAVKTGFIPSKAYIEEMKPKKLTYADDFTLRWDDAVKPWKDAYAERDKVKQFTGK